MSKKTLKFTVSQLIINSSHFDLATFSDLKDADLDTHKVVHKEGEKEEILSIKKFTKTIEEERFITVYSNEGRKFPYTDKVINADLEEHDNPRSAEEIELDDQFFVLIDVKTQRIFMSDQRKKTIFIKWLGDKIKKHIEIKSIISEKEFIQKIKTINKICFTVVRNIFNFQNGDILSNKLLQDIYGFDAEEGHIELSYNDARITDKIVNKLKVLIGRKVEFKDITVIGRSDEDFESIFNINEIISAINIDIDCSDEAKLLDEKIVFAVLIKKIKL
ncbi:conserved hypothetical protein [Candidatus Brocadia pituitae]|nr:conserved hypothetical protein [Candidatus Brocadia pituitae]